MAVLAGALLLSAEPAVARDRLFDGRMSRSIMVAVDAVTCGLRPARWAASVENAVVVDAVQVSLQLAPELRTAKWPGALQQKIAQFAETARVVVVMLNDTWGQGRCNELAAGPELPRLDRLVRSHGWVMP